MTRAAIKARNTIILSSLFFRLRVFGTKRMFGSLTILLLSMSLKFILTDSLPKQWWIVTSTNFLHYERCVFGYYNFKGSDSL